jgi:Flp pilus assembly protein TadD
MKQARGAAPLLNVRDRLQPILICITLLAAAPAAMADELTCGSLENGYGPWDYTNPEHRRLRIPVVDTYHLNADVENLRAGQSGTIMADLDYTLRAVPNHHRALYAVSRYQLAGGDPEQFRTAECYFDRAMRFKPDDGMVYLIYAVHLEKKGQLEEAEKNYRKAIELMPESAEAHYNIGLHYVAVKNYEKALEHAHTAYRLGYPLPGLREKLRRAGKWTDDPQAKTSSHGAAAAAGPAETQHR